MEERSLLLVSLHVVTKDKALNSLFENRDVQGESKDLDDF